MISIYFKEIFNEQESILRYVLSWFYVINYGANILTDFGERWAPFIRNKPFHAFGICVLQL